MDYTTSTFTMIFEELDKLRYLREVAVHKHKQVFAQLLLENDLQCVKRVIRQMQVSFSWIDKINAIEQTKHARLRDYIHRVRTPPLIVISDEDENDYMLDQPLVQQHHNHGSRDDSHIHMASDECNSDESNKEHVQTPRKHVQAAATFAVDHELEDEYANIDREINSLEAPSRIDEDECRNHHHNHNHTAAHEDIVAEDALPNTDIDDNFMVGVPQRDNDASNGQGEQRLSASDINAERDELCDDVDDNVDEDIDIDIQMDDSDEESVSEAASPSATAKRKQTASKPKPKPKSKPKKTKSTKSKKQKKKKETYVCDECDFETPSRSNLTKHQRIHSGEKPFVCHVYMCGKAFSQNGNLRRHMRVHSEERPYPCTRCDKAFKRKDKLALHLRVVHSRRQPFACSQCDYKTGDAANLRRHREICF